MSRCKRLVVVMSWLLMVSSHWARSSHHALPPRSDGSEARAACRISEAEVHELIDLFDHDGDGALDFAEFKGMLAVL